MWKIWEHCKAFCGKYGNIQKWNKKNIFTEEKNTPIIKQFNFDIDRENRRSSDPWLGDTMRTSLRKVSVIRNVIFKTKIQINYYKPIFKNIICQLIRISAFKKCIPGISDCQSASTLLEISNNNIYILLDFLVWFLKVVFSVHTESSPRNNMNTVVLL